MADKLTESYTLKIECLFIDGDTRTITLKNPKDNISTQEINDLETLIRNEVGGVNNSVLIGDKTAADFRRIEKVTRVSTSTIELDLS